MLLAEKIADPHRDILRRNSTRYLFAKDTFHSFLYGKARDLMDKMGEHTVTPERAIALQNIGGPLADMCS